MEPRCCEALCRKAEACYHLVVNYKIRCGDINIFPLFGARDTAERVLLRGRVGSRGGAVLHRGLPMNYGPILRDGLTIADTLSKLSQK